MSGYILFTVSSSRLLLSHLKPSVNYPATDVLLNWCSNDWQPQWKERLFSNIFSKISRCEAPWPFLGHAASLTMDRRMNFARLPRAGISLTQTSQNKDKGKAMKPEHRSTTLAFAIGLCLQISPCS